MNLLNKNFLSRLKKLAKKNKIGICSYCNESKTIFQTVPQKGDQCEDCYREQKKFKKSKRAIQKRKSVKDIKKRIRYKMAFRKLQTTMSHL